MDPSSRFLLVPLSLGTYRGKEHSIINFALMTKSWCSKLMVNHFSTYSCRLHNVGSSVFLKVLAIFTKKNDKSAPKNVHKKTFSTSKFPDFHTKKHFGLQNPHFSLKILEFSHTKKRRPLRGRIFTHKKERRFAPNFHKKNVIRFCVWKFSLKKHWTGTCYGQLRLLF